MNGDDDRYGFGFTALVLNECADPKEGTAGSLWSGPFLSFLCLISTVLFVFETKRQLFCRNKLNGNGQEAVRVLFHCDGVQLPY